MPMSYAEFLNIIIEDGISNCRHSYAHPRHALKLEGAIAGFEACRGLEPSILAELLNQSLQECKAAADNNDPRYWWWRCKSAEIEWVCNVVSAILRRENLPEIICPTARGLLKAASIVGVVA